MAGHPDKHAMTDIGNEKDTQQIGEMAILSGVLLLSGRNQDSWGWAVLLPVFAFLLFIMFLAS